MMENIFEIQKARSRLRLAVWTMLSAIYGSSELPLELCKVIRECLPNTRIIAGCVNFDGEHLWRSWTDSATYCFNDFIFSFDGDGRAAVLNMRNECATRFVVHDVTDVLMYDNRIIVNQTNSLSIRCALPDFRLSWIDPVPCKKVAYHEGVPPTDRNILHLSEYAFYAAPSDRYEITNNGVSLWAGSIEVPRKPNLISIVHPYVVFVFDTYVFIVKLDGMHAACRAYVDDFVLPFKPTGVRFTGSCLAFEKVSQEARQYACAVVQTD
jgi:hypothetical protein